MAEENRPRIVQSARGFFSEIVEEAFSSRRVRTLPQASEYLVSLLEHYLTSDNLFSKIDSLGRRKEESLAETYLTAFNLEGFHRIEMLKRLGDTSLYVSGFFGDSLRRKLVDIEYYAEIGGSAYRSLANEINEADLIRVYEEFSVRFLDFVEILSLISQRLMVQTNGDLLRLYERYLSTGSELAREQLQEKGLITPSTDLKKVQNQ